jgi:hypothetical protein
MEWDLDSIYKAATVVGVAVSAGSLLYIAKQVNAVLQQTSTQKELEGVARADRYVTEYRDIRGKTDRLREHTKNKSIEAICNEIDASPEFRFEWYEVLEYFERIGVLFDLKTIDQRYILRTLDAIIVDAWEMTEPIVKQFRKRDSDPLIFEHLERLYVVAKRSVTKAR